MVFNLEELTDLLLNHPSSWRIPEIIRYNQEKLGAYLLEAQGAAMKHSLEMAEMQKRIDSMLVEMAKLSKKCEQLSNDLGKERLKSKKPAPDMRRLMDGMTHVPIGEL